MFQLAVFDSTRPLFDPLVTRIPSRPFEVTLLPDETEVRPVVLVEPQSHGVGDNEVAPDRRAIAEANVDSDVEAGDAAIDHVAVVDEVDQDAAALRAGVAANTRLSGVLDVVTGAIESRIVTREHDGAVVILGERLDSDVHDAARCRCVCRRERDRERGCGSSDQHGKRDLRCARSRVDSPRSGP